MAACKLGSSFAEQKVRAELGSNAEHAAYGEQLRVGLFQPVSRELPVGLLRKASAEEQVRELGGGGKVLNDLSVYLSGRHQSLARMVDEVVRTANPEKMLKVNAAMIDQSLETDLVAKTIGKTVSAIDQLTKLG